MSEVVKKPDRTPLSQRDPISLAQHFAASGYFRDASDMSKAVVKIVAGEELGIGPMAAMNGIHIIEGKPSLSANLIAGQIKKHPAYDYVIRHSDEQRCEIEFFQNGDPIGTATWTIEEARRARTKQKGNWIPLADTMRWRNSPADMLFNRCISRGARRFCPDVFAGTPIHTPEELEESPDLDEAVHVENQSESSSEPEEVDGEVVETIGPERIEFFKDGFKALGLSIGQIANLFGAAGLDGLRARSKKAIEERLASLTEAEADLLAAELERVADNG